MSDDLGDVTASRLILRQLETLTNSVSDQGKILSSMETNQAYLSRDLSRLTETVEQISKNQIDCPARTGFQGLNGKVAILEDAKRAIEAFTPKKFGKLPAASLQNLIKVLPWILALGAGIAAALGLVDPGDLQ